MKEESDIPLLKSYNKGTTVIEADPFMEKEIEELKAQWEEEKQQMLEEAKLEAEKIIKDIHKKLSANTKITADIRTKSHEKNAGYQAGEIFVSPQI